MSRTLNKVMLIGNVGKEPELKETPGGVPVTSFRMATSESWKDKDGILKEHTDWHTVVAWRGLAKVIDKLVTKGTRIYVEGRLQTRNYEDNDGNRRQVVEILADNMLILEDRKNGKDRDEDDNDDFDFNNDFSSKSKEIDDDFDSRFDD
ncbi:MAG: single-stranded DNA-binding protein [Ignavibacteriae bacterium HGW-Ignavibacteriae-4]|nr:MAG: single-stranded DNA-binding protein [Ignavibacteriae bacterium HGW-Ignavibacteriae-4]